MAIGDSAGILLKIKGDSSDAVRAVDTTTSSVGQLNSATGALSASMAGPLTAAAAAATAGLAATVAVAVRGAETLFDLSKAAAEYGSKIYDASQKTGLHAETLTALKFAAEQAGSSFEQVTKGIVVFGSEVGKALTDTKAAEKMKLLGVTTSDTREALAQAIKTIYDAKTQTEQLSLATEAFGRKIGPDLIPLIKDAHGNLDELEKKAKELGLTLSDDDVKAADEFGDALDQLNDQFKGLTNRIGVVFMPVFRDMAEYVSGWLKDNQDEIDEWAKRTKTNLTGASSYWSEYYHNLQLAGAGYFEWLAHIRESLGPLLGGQIPSGGTFVGQGQIEDNIRNVQQRGADIEARRGSAGLQRTSGTLGSDTDTTIGTTASKSRAEKTLPSKRAIEVLKDVLKPSDFDAMLRQAANEIAKELGIVDEDTLYLMLKATLFRESGGRAGLTSSSGAKGFFQQLPSTSRRLGVKDPNNFLDAAKGTARYLSQGFGGEGFLKGGAEEAFATYFAGGGGGNRGKKTDQYVTDQKFVLEQAKRMLGLQEKITDDEKKQAAERIKVAQDEWTKKGEIGKAGADYVIEQLEREKDAAIGSGDFATATDITQQQSEVRLQAIRDEIQTIRDRFDLETDEQKKKDLWHQLELKNIALSKAELTELNTVQKENNDILQKAIDLNWERIQQDREKFELEEKARQAQAEPLGQEIADALRDQVAAQKEFSEEQARLDDDEIARREQLIDSWHRLKDAMAEAGDVHMATMDIQQMGLDLFDNMIDALQNAIERWLLYGESVGKALKMALAQELAHIAARAAIKALEATAEGFILLAFGQYDKAASAFTAAALYAALAIGAGLAAKALAPKQQAKPTGGAASAGASVT
jgi:hypothetical protein